MKYTLNYFMNRLAVVVWCCWLVAQMAFGAAGHTVVPP